MIIPLLYLNLNLIDNDNCSGLVTNNKPRRKEMPNIEFFDKSLTGNFGVIYSNYSLSSNSFVYNHFNISSFNFNVNQISAIKISNSLFQGSRQLDNVENAAILRAFELQITKIPTRKNRF